MWYNPATNNLEQQNNEFEIKTSLPSALYGASATVMPASADIMIGIYLGYFTEV